MEDSVWGRAQWGLAVRQSLFMTVLLPVHTLDNSHALLVTMPFLVQHKVGACLVPLGAFADSVV